MFKQVTFDVSRCPVCGFHIGIPFYFAEPQPLATLAWPQSASEAQSLEKLPLNFLQCPHCTHIYNKSFQYDKVPYRDHPNRMYNHGLKWKLHLKHTRDLVQKFITMTDPIIVEIGCGEGHFLRELSTHFEQGTLWGFDPNTCEESGKGINFKARLFDPREDIQEFNPDIIIVRHVLEHFLEITPLLESIAWCAAHMDKPCHLFAEVPCIDAAVAESRLSDFYYEHVSHFTTRSFHTLMHRIGEVQTMAHGYDGETIHAIVRLQSPGDTKKRSMKTYDCFSKTNKNIQYICKQIDELYTTGKKVAIWGGVGKAAAFINMYHLDSTRFPLVVDSDQDKVGTYVAGTGQKIMYRDHLLNNNVDCIIIPSLWRAGDIIKEMQSANIFVESIYVEHNGELALFEQGD